MAPSPANVARDRDPAAGALPSLFLTIARFATAAWIGAAVLFVITGVREVRWPDFDSTTRDMLVTIRFPAYYAAGFALLGVGFICAMISRRHPALGRRAVPAIVLLALALALFAFDFTVVYQPLANAVQPPGQTRPPWFERYHQYSMQVNSVVLLASLGAALLLCWAGRGDESVRESR